jgi:RNA polymerase sigma-54 factor
MNSRNDLQQVQMQRLSPLMLRSLNVLQLPMGELQRLIASEIQSNPLLDIGANDALPHFNSIDARGRAENTANAEEDNLNFLENIAEECSPREYLLAQVPEIDGETKAAFIALINSLDDRGFLSEDAAEQLGISPMDIGENSNPLGDGAQKNAFEKAYAILRSLSPKGIGARNLRDCLQLQIPKNTPLYDLVTHHFEDLECRRFAKLGRKLRRTPSELRSLLVPLRRLNFTPLKIISSSLNPVIIPEIIFQKINRRWCFEIRGLGGIKMSELYGELLIRPLGGEDRKFFTQNKRHAQFWMKSLEQRRETLQKIAQYILKFQGDFLEKGNAFLRPQSQKQTAELLAIHPSTLSRAIRNKYAQIGGEIIPLNFFFSHGNHGSLTAQHALRENIRNKIKNEDRNAPLSDEKVAKMMKNDGIWMARRTVAKYRALLRIPPANIRKYM